MWIRIGAVAPCFTGPGKRRRPCRGGVCVHRGKTKQWLCLGTVAPEREARHGEGSHTQKKIEKKRDRGRDGERMRVGEWGSGERERTLPGGSFFLSAIINGILPLTHSSRRQTKDPAFQWSLTSQPASHPTTVEPHRSPQLDQCLITGMGLGCAVHICRKDTSLHPHALRNHLNRCTDEQNKHPCVFFIGYCLIFCLLHDLKVHCCVVFYITVTSLN